MVIDEVAVRVSFTLETSVLLCALGVDRALGERGGVREWLVPSVEELGSSRRLTLPGFSIGSATEVLDEDAGEEGEGVEVGFGFGDGYDLAAFEAGLCEGLLEGVSDEAVS